MVADAQYPNNNTDSALIDELIRDYGEVFTVAGLAYERVVLIVTKDAEKVKSALDSHLTWWRKLDEARQRALVNMTFGLGVNGLLSFKNTLAALESGNFDSAADAIVDSKWYKRDETHASRIANIIRYGNDGGDSVVTRARTSNL